MMMNFINNFKQRKQRGIGLLELMLSLSIIAILLVMATRYFLVASLNEKVNTTVSTIGGLQAAVGCYTSAPFTDMTLANLAQSGCLSSQLYAGPKTAPTGLINPWGGISNDWTLTATNITVKFGNIPQDGCKNLEKKYAGDDRANLGGCGSNSNILTYIVAGTVAP